MERTVWTDERLNDAMTTIDARFDRVDAAFADMRTELRRDIAELRRDIAELRRDMHQMALAIGVGYLGLAAAVIAAVA